MTDGELVRRYLPLVHFDEAETIPLRAVGWTVARETVRSASFPKREIPVEEGTALTIEYAYYWDYDIQHQYDLEHIWVMVGGDGQVVRAEGSFHGKYLNLWQPGLEAVGALPPEGGRVHAFCQPGKHAFVPAPALCRVIPDWFGCCNVHAGGPVLVGGPFEGRYSPSALDDELSRRWLRGHLAFEPTLRFRASFAEVPLMPWPEMAAQIPGWVAAESARLRETLD